MRGKYLKGVTGFIITTLMLSGIVFASAVTTDAQARRRTVVIIPRRQRVFRHRGWGYDDPWSPYNMRYRQYVFDNGEKAVNQGYKDGFKTGKDDGKKSKSYDPQRSHYYHDSGFGNFAEVYRSGFSRGYQEGYRVGGNSRAT